VQPQHYNAECPADDQEVDSHLFRLFVGWVPKQFTEEDLKPIFQQCGFVQDILILRDQVTGQHRGCAFVSYATQDEAENAIETLDRKLQLPGALSFLEVRFARSHHFVQAGHGPQDNKQLFFAKAPVTASEEDIYQLFSTFGEVRARLSRCQGAHMHLYGQSTAGIQWGTEAV
jgi:CUG-BP- and ETR3-like factor